MAFLDEMVLSGTNVLFIDPVAGIDLCLRLTSWMWDQYPGNNSQERSRNHMPTGLVLRILGSQRIHQG